MASQLVNPPNMSQPYGVSYSGATYKYTVVDTTGRRSAAQGQLLSASSGTPLTSHSCSRPDAPGGVPVAADSVRLLRARADEQLHREPLCGLDEAHGPTLYRHGRRNPELEGRDHPADRGRLVEEGTVPTAGGVDTLGDADRSRVFDYSCCYCARAASEREGAFLADDPCHMLMFPTQREDELERRRASHHINFDAL